MHTNAPTLTLTRAQSLICIITAVVLMTECAAPANMECKVHLPHFANQLFNFLKNRELCWSVSKTGNV